jgi:phosphohistidine phosphatase
VMPSSRPAPLRHLWLLRHGKAATDAPRGGSDRQRPLTDRGRGDAKALGSALAADDPLGLVGVPRPQLVVCSAAVRTRETADLVVKGLGGRVPLESYRSLYAATPDILLRYVHEIDAGVESALVVGHNPGIFELAWLLLANRDDDRPSSDRAFLEVHGFPTCSLAVIAVEAPSWADVGSECGHLTGLFKPPY